MTDFPSLNCMGALRWLPERRAGWVARFHWRWRMRAPMWRWDCATKIRGDSLVQEIEALGRRALALQMDVLHMDQITEADRGGGEHSSASSTFW